MATERQKATVEKLVEQSIQTGGKISVSKAMREATKPYSAKTAKTPKKLTNSKGFREELKRQGLTAGFILKALVEDIKNKPMNRLGELRLGAEITKLVGNEKRLSNAFNTIIFTDEQSAEIARRRLASDRSSEETSD